MHWLVAPGAVHAPACTECAPPHRRRTGVEQARGCPQCPMLGRSGHDGSSHTESQQGPSPPRLVYGLVCVQLRHNVLFRRCTPLCTSLLFSQQRLQGCRHVVTTQGSQRGCTVESRVEPQKEAHQKDSAFVKLA